MSPHTKSLIDGLIALAAAIVALGAEWLVGALTNHTLSIPAAYATATPFVIALLTFSGTLARRYITQSNGPPLPTPAPPVEPPTPG